MDGRGQFTFYRSFFEAVGRIKSKSARADAYDAICAYALDGVMPDIDKLPDSAAVAFLCTRPNLESGRRKAQSGRAGGTSQKQEEPERKPEANGKQTGSKQEEDASKKKDKKKNKNKYKCNTPIPPCQQIVDDYNSVCTKLAAVRMLTEKRAQSIREVMAQGFTQEDLHEVFVKAQTSSFLTGENGRGWRADFDWLIRKDHATRILEGSFDDRKSSTLWGASGQLGEAEMEALQRILKEE